jgi:hypothetical protein
MRAPPIRPSGITVLKEPSIAVWLCRACSGRTAHSNRSEISSSFLDPGTAQRSLAKEENREKDCRYRYRAYGRGLRDKPTVFTCADDEDARSTVIALAKDIGFDGVDAGPLDASRNIENLGLLVG